jgi:hypothetical protein
MEDEHDFRRLYVIVIVELILTVIVLAAFTRAFA